jgi:hypothetical protein
MPALTDKQKKDRAKKLKQRKDGIQIIAEDIMKNDDEISEEDAIEQATEYYKDWKKLQDKIKKKSASSDKKRSSPDKKRSSSSGEANEKRSEYQKAITKRAQELYYRSDGVTKRGKYTWPEAQKKAHAEYKKEHGERKSSKKKSPCSGVEPDENDECDEPCPVKYKSKSGNSFCKSKPKRSVKPDKKSKKSSKSKKTAIRSPRIYGPKASPFNIRGHLHLGQGRKFTINNKGDPVEFKVVKHKRYLFDKKGKPVEVDVINEKSLVDKEQEKRDKKNARQREYRRKKREESEEENDDSGEELDDVEIGEL